jgi:hypothetical protein
VYAHRAFRTFIPDDELPTMANGFRLRRPRAPSTLAGVPRP